VTPSSEQLRELDAKGHRLRVLNVAPTYYPAVRYGGPIRSVHGLAAALARRGHEVHVYTTSMDGSQDLNVPLDEVVDLDGVAVRYFRVPAARRLFWAPAMLQRLRTTIADFDVVHIHSVFLWPMWVAAREAARAGVPYVLSPRGMLIRDVIVRKSRWTKTAWIQLIERKSLALASAVHVTAEVEGDELKSLGLPAPGLMTIPNGVEWPQHTPQPHPFVDLPQRYVLFLGRISWKKGLDRLITSWQWVPDIPLVIAGNDDEGYRRKLEVLAQSVGVADRVRFIGPVSDTDKWALYEGAELFVLPSYSENFGNAVAEAMAMRCPVAVTEEVGIATLVRSEAAGLVVSGEPDQLAAGLREVLSDSARRAEMGRRGRLAVERRLSWNAVAEQTESLYRTVLRPEPDREAA
jgi:glycosyltransferase involved in cell wall biosynthesis